MRKSIVITSVLLVLFLAGNVFGQDASLSGIVTDSSESIIPGVTITATNDNTGIVSTSIANDSGAYSFPLLPIGVYTVTAELDSFQTKTFTEVSLSVGSQARLNFELEVSGVTTTIDVTSSAKEIDLESGSSVGDILLAETVMDLPQIGRDALDLIKVMSGVVVADDETFGRTSTTFAGQAATGVNVQRDGVTVNDVRFPTGINAATRVNPDMVGEFKMTISPVDAEAGRGNAQIQIATKSGANTFHGNAVWNVQNTALDPNSWENNRTGTVAPWRNLQNFSASVSGPIVKNKTFFFVLVDTQFAKSRAAYNAMSLTPCARQGIFRFWDRWNNQNADYSMTSAESSSNGSDPTIAGVDFAGNPLSPEWEPGGWGETSYTGQLRYASVYGTLLNPDELNADCSNAILDTGAGSWDPLRPEMDPSGFIADFLEKLPAANNYEIGDGLNTAGFRWTRGQEGAENLWGVGEDTYRRQLNVKIDHNFTNEHRISGSWSFERDHADDTMKTWPENSWSGGGERQPQVLSLNFQSSFRPNLLNEFKFGMSRTGSNIFAPQSRPSNGDALQNYLAEFGTLYDGQVGVVEPGTGLTGSFRTDGPGATASTPYGTRGFWAIGNLIDSSPRYTLGDTLTWVKGTHTLKFGGEFRRASSKSETQWILSPSFSWADSFPEYQGGELPLTPQTFDNVTGDLAGSSANSGNQRAMRDLLIFLSGSLNQVKQARYVNTIDATDWNDPIAEPSMVRDVIMKEFSVFVKDDWKIRTDLTLNLGVRWDYYGVPYVGNGMTVGLEGGGGAIFGPTDSYDNWFRPISQGDTSTGSLVALRSLGPGGEHPGESIYANRYSNIGPAVGFAYQLPWFGKGKTTIRGGYQLSYLSFNGNFSDIQGAASQSPGFNYLNFWNNGGTWAEGEYFGIKDLATNPIFENGVPLSSPDTMPGLTEFSLYDRTQSVTAYAPNYRSPYVQNLTFAFTRKMTSNLTVDLRYIGTLSRHNFSSKNLNVGNFLTNGLLEAFDAARRGENPVLLDELLMGVAPLPWGCTIDGDECRAGQALRDAAFPTFNLPFTETGAFTNLNLMLAEGNYLGLANALTVLDSGSGKGRYIEDNGFPVNFIKASPQFSAATLFDNQGSNNYHSFQAQITLRPTSGLYFQSTYTWSKNLGNGGGLSPDPRDMSTGYTLLSGDRPHNWVTYGNFDLPFGPGKLLGADTDGVLAKVIGGWQLGWITNITSGAPLNMAANCGLYANCTPSEVNGGIDASAMDLIWPDDARNGQHFFGGERYTFIDDPQCTDSGIVDPSLQSLCNHQAVFDNTAGEIVLQNPLPGELGNMAFNKFRDVKRWNVDMSASKGISVTEDVNFRFRVDISNIFNHPRPTAPSMNINGNNPLGQVGSKVGARTIQAMLRIDF